MVKYEQGDIIKVEGVEARILVVSNNVFHREGLAMCCPLVKKAGGHPLHIICNDAAGEQYIALTEHVKMLDISERGFMVIGRVVYSDVINISDTLQGLFEY